MSRVRETQDDAAQWIIAREEPGWTTSDQAELDEWLAKSDLHRVTFIRLEQGWREADRIGSLGTSLMPESLCDNRARYYWVKRAVPLAAAASLVAAIGLGSHVFVRQPKTEVANTRYDTKIGAHRTIDLPDGSKIELNTASDVRTAVTDFAREVWLDQGEAYFEVEHDKSRPFVVHAGNRRITVLGTKFSVKRDGDKVSILVREGRVRVDDIQGAETMRSTTITSGEIALTQGPATLVAAKSDERVENALAWREGMLSFDQDPLSDVAAEFNRYNRQQLIVTDKDAANIRIGGIFPASKPVDFVRLLRDAYGLKIEETPEAIRISS
tara:strand:+ start:1223 stop:2200 length:978 start_codon:yes stop_codon:yes gene_type:complete